ncbi:MAG: Cof-type HAD-IIB family hydrolase [Dethiobacteria bacterium]|nr:Cof-type HAD-IIB family hydrolase [Bacillota bacterium]MDW7729249.1 Cof-type HAD-IIB family hydrolase [Bacillota bacterium]
MRYKMIATDLDDTLLDENSKISIRNKIAIRRAVKTGVRFVIATGRMFKTSVVYLDDLELNGDCPLINYHGAMVKKAKSREIILHRPIDKNIAMAVIEEAERKDCHISLFVDDELYIREENDYSRYYQSMAHVGLQAVGDLGAFLKENGAEPTKISIIRWDGTIDEIETGLRGKFGDKLSILQSRPYFLEITDQKATKGQTLSWLAEKEGIKAEEIIAFGDGHNDLDMVRYAGLGVAVANARPEVLEAADVVTFSNTDDGVAEVIEKYVLDL